MALIKLNSDINEYSDNIVTNLEVIIPNEFNNADSVNDVIIPAIINSGLHIIGNEVNWGKDLEGNNIIRVFGATEGRVIPATDTELKLRLEESLPF